MKSAVALRRVLVTLMVFIILLAGVGFYFAQNWLGSFAVSISHKVADSKTSNNSIQSLQKLQADLSGQQNIITKADAIVTSTNTFQTQAVQDLTTYAGDTGITITNFTFPVPTATTAAATPTTASPVPSTQVTITIASPVDYTNLLKFMSAIEGNLPKMQITNIELQRDTTDGTAIDATQLTVAVYTN